MIEPRSFNGTNSDVYGVDDPLPITTWTIRRRPWWHRLAFWRRWKR